MTLEILCAVLFLTNLLNLVFLKKNRQVIADLFLIVCPVLLFWLSVDYVDLAMTSGNPFDFLMLGLSFLIAVVCTIYDLKKFTR